MDDGNKMISLLGKSEKDEQVRKMLEGLNVAMPLKRPKKGEDTINIVLKKIDIELAFQYAEVLFPKSDNYAEGELIFSTVFFYPSRDKNAVERFSFPFGLSEKLSRKMVQDRLGKPSWNNPHPKIKSDRWIVGNVKIFIEFEDDETSINQLIVFIGIN